MNGLIIKLYEDYISQQKYLTYTTNISSPTNINLQCKTAIVKNKITEYFVCDLVQQHNIWYIMLSCFFVIKGIQKDNQGVDGFGISLG